MKIVDEINKKINEKSARKEISVMIARAEDLDSLLKREGLDSGDLKEAKNLASIIGDTLTELDMLLSKAGN